MTLTKLTRLLLHIPVCAPILVIAGDLGNPFSLLYETVLQWSSLRFEYTVIVLGNHEFYGHTYESTTSRVERIASTFHNVFFLRQGHSFDVPNTNLRFVGATLWTPKGDCDVSRILEWTQARQEVVHGIDFTWIASELARAAHESKRVVVVSHHVPSVSLIHTKYRSFSSDDFACSCETLFESPVLLGWIYGHTHMMSHTTVSNIPFLCNPVGYPGENACVRWNSVIEFNL